MLLNNFVYLLVNAVGSEWGTFVRDAVTPRIKFTDGSLFAYDNPTGGGDFEMQPSGFSTGTIVALLPSKFYNTTRSSQWSTGYPYIVLGDGDQPPTVDDFKLSGNLISSLNYQSIPNTLTNSGLTYSLLAVNNTTEPVTIKEVSFAIGTAPETGSSGAAVLLTRDVLPSPITLNPSDSKVISISLDFRSLTNSLNNGN